MTEPSQTPGPPSPGVVRYELPAKRPIITYSILAVTILFFILQQATVLLTGTDIVALWLAKNNGLIYFGQMWRLLTPVLAHADIIHIGMNMYALVIIGGRLERTYGHSRFILLYLLSGIAGNLFSFYLTPNLSIGASTAIFGLLAAEGIYIYNHRHFFPQAQRVLTNLIFILIFNLIYGFSLPNIDIWGHVGGFLGGLAFAWFAGPQISLHRTDTGIQLSDDHLGKSAVVFATIEFAVLMSLAIFRILVHP